MFGYRVSKGVTSGVIALLQETGVAFTEGVYVAVALAAAGAWAALAVPLGRHYNDAGEDG